MQIYKVGHKETSEHLVKIFCYIQVDVTSGQSKDFVSGDDAFIHISAQTRHCDFFFLINWINEFFWDRKDNDEYAHVQEWGDKKL